MNPVFKARLKKLKNRFAQHLKPFLLGLLVTAAVATIAERYYQATTSVAFQPQAAVGLNRLIREIHEKTVDWRMRFRGPRAVSSDVAVLAIDERSIELEGRWPWSRQKMAELVDRTMSLGAKSISFDIVFSEEDSTSAIPTLKRLKRELSGAGASGEVIARAIEAELVKENGDQIFSDTVAKWSDHLILGAYSDLRLDSEADDNNRGQAVKPATELCFNALIERTYPSFYWRKEQIQFEVHDPLPANLHLPTAIKQNISDYVTNLEVQTASDWFAHHPEKPKVISEALLEIGNPLPQESFPGVATLWVNGNLNALIDLLHDAKPELANPDAAQRLFTLFATAFSKKESAEIAFGIRRVGTNYCATFFTDLDPLLDYQTFKRVWGAHDEEKPPEEQAKIKELFDVLTWANVWKEVQRSDPAFQNEAFVSAKNRLTHEAPENSMSEIWRSWINILQIASVTRHSGVFDTTQDTDGTVRRSPIIKLFGDVFVPSLALKTFLLNSGLKPALTIGILPKTRGKPATRYVRDLEILNSAHQPVMRLPIDTSGNLMINYAGPQHMFAHVSAADILSNEAEMKISVQRPQGAGERFQQVEETVNKKEFMKDRALFLGVTATGVFDLRVTPFMENYPGVETHANVLSNLLVETERARNTSTRAGLLGFLRTDPREPKYMTVTLILVGLTLSALLSWVGSVFGLLLTLAALGGVYIIDNFVIFPRGIVTTSLFPVFLIVSDFVALTFYKYFTEERTKRELKGTFEKYVSPSIVAEVLADPENIELGGKKMNLTVMFSDVRGFTTISEKLDPRALADLLNGYLTPMTQLVFKNKGTLDKYMGDAIMAFWGAPISFSDHAEHACRCALQMLDELKVLQADYRAKGFPEIDIGIGLNSGDMSVGNMGSDSVRSYTVMGDAVNLGSRLEGINKQYGTRIVISEFTYQAVKEKFVTRELDWVRVKGKLQPVRIFELVAERNDPTARAAARKSPAPTNSTNSTNNPNVEMLEIRGNIAQCLASFDEGFVLYHQRDFANAVIAFEKALYHLPDDAPSQLYIERCRDYLALAPPGDWDGVFTMISK